MFFEEVSGACDGYSGVGFALSECTLELNFLKNIVRFRLLSEMNALNLENGYINNVLDLMKAPFDRPYKFSVIFTREESFR